jgi:ketosteroid isomerase-like protein
MEQPILNRSPITTKENYVMNDAARNADTVRRGYKAFNAGDMKTLTEIFHENASWHTPGRSRIAGDYNGREAAFAQFGRYGSETGGTFKAVLQSVAVGDDGRIISTHHNTAKRNGKQLDVDCCLVFEFKDGKCLSGREYFYDLRAWDEFWS